MSNRSAIAGLLAAVFFVLLSFAAGWSAFWIVERGNIPLISQFLGPSPKLAAQQGKAAVQGDMPLFWEAMTLLNDHYYDPEAIPTGNDATYAAIEGVIDATGDPHTGFMDPERTKIVQTDLSGEFEGIGATVEMGEAGLVIVSPFADSPAEQAGLLPGDVVVAVDDQSTLGMTVDEAVAIVRGPAGTVVKLTIQRTGEAEPFDVEVTRGSIIVPVVETKMLRPTDTPPIGYIRLNDFGGRSVEQFTAGVQELLDQGAARLIVDLRNDPGGYLDAAVRITSQFVDEGLVLSERGTDRDQEYAALSGGIALDVPLAVLINGGSASASEIFAGAIRDLDRGVLIGETSFGKGSVQITRDLSDGSSMRITVARWFTPNGEAIHEVGIAPDIEVPFRPNSQGYLPDIAVDIESGNEGLTVTKLYEGTEAAASGLQVGDLITEIDGISTLNIGPPQAQQLGSGPEGSAARLTVQRNGEAREFNVNRSYPETWSEGDPQLEAAIDYFREP
ncbi:MAG: PDZ domain-containing protein [Anaerolineales bacterium]|nr:PDZ domain-containing protein [Anaerolineales bacterium]MCB9127547.1 PDZ domain-containing protein [Ardenticatenales bacterium]